MRVCAAVIRETIETDFYDREHELINSCFAFIFPRRVLHLYVVKKTCVLHN